MKEKTIEEILKYENRFFIPEDIQKLLAGYIDLYIKNCCQSFDQGASFFRSRIHKPNQSACYDCKSLGAPPPSRSSSGRINPEGMPCLYLSAEEETAVSEVRPWVGAELSVGMFSLKKGVKVILFSEEVASEEYGSNLRNNRKSRLASLFNGIEADKKILPLFSMPIHEHDKLSYLPTQWVSEYVKSKGYDGVGYKSVLKKGGSNIALFNPDVAECIKIQKYKVSSVKYEVNRIA